MKTILDQELDKKFKKDEAKRPDLILKTLQNQLVLVELKRPNYTITVGDLPKLLGYLSVIRQHMPQMKMADCYLVGGRYDESLQDMTTSEGDRIFRTSYAELVENAQFRYREILDVLATEVMPSETSD